MWEELRPSAQQRFLLGLLRSRWPTVRSSLPCPQPLAGISNASGTAESAVRPISAAWKSLWIALLGIAWVLVVPVQWVAGVLSSAAGAAAAAGLFLVPAIISSATLAALVVAVLPTAHRSSGRGVRRPDLACAAIGGALLGVCVWPLASGAIALAVAFTVFGVALIGVGVWLRRRQGA